jgi:pimeloyl-ACP methyl ester carboxylesterase
VLVRALAIYGLAYPLGLGFGERFLSVVWKDISGAPVYCLSSRFTDLADIRLVRIQSLQVEHPRFQFAVCVSGFKLEHPVYQRFYQPKIETPIMHLIATYDTLIPKPLTDNLINACSNCDVHVFEGTHHVPRRLGQTKAASHFILQQLGWASGASVTAHPGVPLLH